MENKKHTYSIKLSNHELELVNACCEEFNIPKTVLFKEALDVYFQYVGVKPKTFGYIFNTMSEEQKRAAEFVASEVVNDYIREVDPTMAFINDMGEMLEETVRGK